MVLIQEGSSMKKLVILCLVLFLAALILLPGNGNGKYNLSKLSKPTIADGYPVPPFPPTRKRPSLLMATQCPPFRPSISLHRLRLTVQSVSPGAKRFRRLRHALRQQAGEDFAVQPGACAGRIFFRQVPQSHDRFHALESQLNLPAQAVEFQNH